MNEINYIVVRATEKLPKRIREKLRKDKTNQTAIQLSQRAFDILNLSMEPSANRVVKDRDRYGNSGIVLYPKNGSKTWYIYINKINENLYNVYRVYMDSKEYPLCEWEIRNIVSFV